ncbi:MAG TPA: rhomboid family intramembrane serine protease [Myxococcota bacterium]|nr:rhomboid family intramembrane serine protease [Myxococcota bacterium]HRY94331.1 rhomboid family intramembrane serine protease [Myxococcota bacterium]HSA21212.1 rhomboid family intramembrane serine protease [Myxococcota bacterium]
MPGICPKCLADLSPLRVEGVELDLCPACRGVWLDPGELARMRGARADLPADQAPLTTGARALASTTSICPRCDGAFETLEFARGTALYIDRCKSCHGIWLDAGELKRIRAVTAQRHGLGLDSPPPADARLRDLARPVEAGGSSPGVYLFQLLTALPVEVDAPRERFPLVTLGLVLACAVTFLYQAFGVTDPEAFLAAWAFLPAQVSQGRELQGLWTHMFLHGGLLHLLGNMYFLWLFGDNVEDRLNRFLYLVFFVTCGLGAAGLHAWITSEPGIPTLGASGAVSGVMGAYLLLYPRRKMYQVLWFFQFKVSVGFYLFFWLGLQLVYASLGMPGVAWWAHVGGFGVGAGLLWLFRRLGLVRPEPDPATAPA